jgi:hypothetical protein
VLETPGETIPIEVKWTDAPRAVDAKHVRLFLDSYPEKARRGYLVCRCSAARQLDERVTAVPWDAF